MVAYSFKSRFAAPILAGTKAQTIRADRKRHARPGEQVQLFTGMRTRQCTKLGEAPCLEVSEVTISLPVVNRIPSVLLQRRLPGLVSITTLCDAALDTFAREDGFRDFDEMVAFWRAEHPGVDVFQGTLIRWQPLAPADALDIAGAA